MKKSELINAVNNIYLSEKSKEKIIRRALTCKKEKEKIYMSKKKTGALILAAALILGVAAYAASGIVSSWSSHSYSTPEYTTLPTAEQCIRDIGYSPVLIEEFESGYVFKEASVVSNSLNDENGKSLESFKSIDLRYQKGDDKLYISADKYSSELEISGDKLKNINGTDVYYSKYMNKRVPGNYKMTDEDKKAEADGEMVFSYGTEDIEIAEVQNMYFEADGIKYTLTQLDATATIDELLSIAEEIINN